ncbi:cytochrome C oxidase subunit IV family protein [Paraliomyxa miuraensis]|uniref:cytochrome C oxidase subunit IV family protein n=1 Tax=Paraliomyxa miuraensis TaxID=376150 RepID=UPI002251CEA5|nr:cytochrome C oxidase subunit IV family protein [Paraliomyxa miuraensis]MCX4239852.1 cytochrome C oxidase subunit IV family protein [Paraliomyxa miuraensis]
MSDANHDEADARLFLHGKPVEGYEECHEHISPMKAYYAVFGALLVLTGLTYAVSYMSLGPASLPVAMVVAVAKASLVCMYFMHLKYDDRYHVFVFLSTIIFVGIFFTFTIFDLNSRTRLIEEQGTFFRNNYDREPPPTPEPAEGHGEGAAGHAEGEAGHAEPAGAPSAEAPPAH